MHPIDLALRDAWRALADRLANDPTEAPRRAARAARAIQHPTAAWCIRLRAADTRIDDWGIPHDPDAVANLQPHPLHLTQSDIADLTAPIHFPYPGLDWTDAAKALGRPKETIRNWIKADVFETTWYDDRARGKIGHLVPWVHTRAPLDPSAHRGKPPHPIWGALWQGLANQLPADYKTTLLRTHYPNPHAPSPPPLGTGGWHFQCPGRPHLLGTPKESGAGLHPAGLARPNLNPSPHPSSFILHPSPCPRIVRTLYLPLPPYTIADLEGPIPGLPSLKPLWASILSRPPACDLCWNIQRTRPLDGPNGSMGWNQLVTALSGGLLKGSEVQRPDCLPRRARPPKTTFIRKPFLRQAILEGIVAGHTRQQIADHLNVTLATVNHHAANLRRDHNVKSNKQLQAKLAPWTPTPALKLTHNTKKNTA